MFLEAHMKAFIQDVHPSFKASHWGTLMSSYYQGSVDQVNLTATAPIRLLATRTPHAIHRHTTNVGPVMATVGYSFAAFAPPLVALHEVMFQQYLLWRCTSYF